MDEEQRIAKARKLASYTIAWWQNHHRKQEEAMLYNMAMVEVLRSKILYCREISQEKAEEAVQYKVQAALEHDIAELLEDNRHQEESIVYWRKTEKLLEKYYSILLEYAE